MQYSLSEIAGNNELVLVDANFARATDNFARRLYEMHDEFTVSKEEISERINELSYSIVDIRQNQNILTIEEVISEMEEYISILNDVLRYHRKNMLLRKFGTKAWQKKGHRKTPQKEHGRTLRHIPISVDEEIALKLFELYVDKNFELVGVLENREIKLKKQELLEQVKTLVETVGLKRDYGERYCDYHIKKTRQRDTDERLALAAYELAIQGKCIAVVSNDSDLKRIFAYFFDRNRLFTIPDKSYLGMYSDFDKDRKFSLQFDTRMSYNELDAILQTSAPSSSL